MPPTQPTPDNHQSPLAVGCLLFIAQHIHPPPERNSSTIIIMSAVFRGTYSRKLYPADDNTIFYSEPSVHSHPLKKTRNAKHEEWLLLQYEHRLRVKKFTEDPRTTFGTVFDVENVPLPVHTSNPLTVIDSCTGGGRLWYNVGKKEKAAAWVYIE